MAKSSVDPSRALHYSQDGKKAETGSACELPVYLSWRQVKMDHPLGNYFDESTLSSDYVSKNTHLVMSSTAGDIEEVHDHLRKGAVVSTGDYRPVLGAAMNGHIQILKVLFAAESVPTSALKAARRVAKEHGEEATVEFLEKTLENAANKLARKP